jgi:drug/metabolite transporter (DMT)-like permease
MLILATALWGCSFTWAKAGGAGVNQVAGLPGGALLGPMYFLSLRFGLAAVLWFLLFPAARRGWTRASASRALALGFLLWFPMTLQMLGLDRTTEAVSAFLTSLTIVFVPLAMTFILGRPPRSFMWVAVAVAGSGIWLMTGAAPTGFGLGELLGLLCAVLFSAHLIALTHLMPKESVWRMGLGQFVVVGIGAGAVSLAAGGAAAMAPAATWRILTASAGGGVFGAAGIDGTARVVGVASAGGAVVSPAESIGLHLALVVVFSTMIAFGLTFAFQPRVTPTRAAIIYVAEPVFAALFAWLVAGRALSPVALIGAALIILANAMAARAGQPEPGAGP